MTRPRAEALLAAVIIARSTSFVFNKMGLGTMTPFNLLAARRARAKSSTKEQVS